MTIRLLLLTLLAALLISVSQLACAESVQEVAAKRKAMAADKPYTSVVPRANEPTGELTVLALWPYEPDMRFAVAALQGIVNREQPRLYIGYDKILRWMQYHSGKVTIDGEYDIDKVFEMYKDKVKGLIIYDDQFDAGLNIAITYAGIEDLLPVTPQLAESLSTKFGWKVVHDLRGRWTDRVEAYKWAFENLRPKCTNYALMHFKFAHIPNDGSFEAESWRHQVAHSVDYAVMARMFVWHIYMEPVPGEMELANRIMESVPFYTPVFGASSGKMLAEPVFVTYVSTYANLHIPLYSPNVSVLSGVRIPDDQLKQKRLPVTREIDPDKIYIAFTNSEHDNMGHVIGGGVPWKSLGMETDDPYKMWWADPMRGKVPIGWPIGPLLCELAPTILARMTMTATDNDYFMAALSGISLTNIPDFGAAYPGMEDELSAGYAKLTGEYLNRLGWTMINPWSGPGTLRAFTQNIPGLEGIFEGYGRHPGVTYEHASYLLDGVPVFHNLTKGSVGTSRDNTISESYAIKSKTMVDQIKEVKVDERPAFMHVWTMGWDFSPTILKMVADQLPPEYVVVRPDELAVMFKKHKEAQAKLNSHSVMIKASGNVTETPNGDSGLIINTGKIKVEIGWGNKPQPPIKRVMGVDGKWRGSGTLLLSNSKNQTVESFSCEKLKDSSNEKQYLLKYIYSNGGSVTTKMTALMGQPYLLVEETISMKHVPTWSFNVSDGFKPDTCWSDKQIEPIDYKGLVEKGKLPWSSWLMAGKKDGPERDMIGIIAVSWDKWNNGQIVFRQRDKSADFESYYYRSGIKKFAIAALDKNDPKAPEEIYRELNTR